jgi:hypothetical protein
MGKGQQQTVERQTGDEMLGMHPVAALGHLYVGRAVWRRATGQVQAVEQAEEQPHRNGQPNTP